MASILCIVSSQINPKTTSPKVVVHDRHCADFPPSAWGEHFIQYSNNGIVCNKTEKEIQELKMGVKRNLEAVSNKPSQHLNMIDAIDRLGLGYHFEEEIEEAMASMFQKSQTAGYDLYDTSLHFRLMRKHGYNVPSDMFNKYVDANGGIKHEFHGDIRGLLGLYEAAHLRNHSDKILNKALNASSSILESSILTTKIMHDEVKRALTLPLHNDMTRLRTCWYITNKGNQHDTNLLKMAKLDFNLLQQRHQYELSQLTTWWKELGLATKCHFVRDRVVETYVWSLVMFYEPQYGLARAIFTKIISFVTTFDDIYDAFGTGDELELLTKAFFRWDTSLIEQMPEYMKAPYQGLLDQVKEIEVELQGKSYRTDYLRRVLQICFKAYHDQQIWFMNGHIPTLEEYMKVGVISGTGQLTTILAMVGMEDDDITEEVFKWVFNNPKIIIANSIHNRLMHDIATHKFEQERGHAPSAVECYMKQYDASEQETYKVLKKRVTNTWKDMNECCLRPTNVPLKVLERILNIARLVQVFYKDGDGLTQAQKLMKDEVTSLLVNPIPV